MEAEKTIINSYHPKQIKLVYISRVLSILVIIATAVIITSITINKILSEPLFYLVFIVCMVLAVSALWIADISSSHLCNIPESVTFFHDMAIIKYSKECHKTEAIKWKYIRNISKVECDELAKLSKWEKIFSQPIKFTLNDDENIIIFNLDNDITDELERRFQAVISLNKSTNVHR